MVLSKTFLGQVRVRNTKMALSRVLFCVLGGSLGCSAPAPKVDDTLVCICKCDEACTDQQVIVATGTDGVTRAACTTVHPGYPNPAAPNASISVRECALAGSSPATRQAACDARCSAAGGGQLKGNKELPNSNGFPIQVVGGPGNPLLATRICQGASSAALSSSKTCNVTPGLMFSQTALTASTGPTNSSVQATSQSTATAMLPNENEGFDTVPIPPPTGSMQFSGGNCPGELCQIRIDALTLNVPPFVAQGKSIGPGVVVNTQAIVGTKDPLERITFTPSASDFFATATVDGVQSAGALTAAPLIRGSYSPTTGLIQLNGDFSDPTTGASLSIQFQGNATARPPIANGGVDKTAACPANGLAVVSLTGAATVDPDGDAMTFAWSENGIVLANTSVASVSITSGVHNLVLTATDSTGRVDQDLVVVTVTDAVAPKFTFVPPTVAVETPGVVAIGQATASDGCGSAVTVTNNAPSGFPIGKTTVTWSATDASGNRATAVQLVYVLPPNATSCPSGMHIILGTSNNDVLTGTSGADCIIGFGGQDRIDGGGGDDIIIGGDGDDILIGGAGNDIIVGGTGQDTITGGDGDDLLVGSDGDDTLSGGNGNDTLLGSAGNDHLNGDAGNDVLAGNAGNDTLQGGAGTDRCISDPPPNQDVVLTCE